MISNIWNHEIASTWSLRVLTQKSTVGNKTNSRHKLWLISFLIRSILIFPFAYWEGPFLSMRKEKTSRIYKEVIYFISSPVSSKHKSEKIRQKWIVKSFNIISIFSFVLSDRTFLYYHSMPSRKVSSLRLTNFR